MKNCIKDLGLLGGDIKIITLIPFYPKRNQFIRTQVFVNQLKGISPGDDTILDINFKGQGK